MTIIEPGSSTSGLVARVKGILLTPDSEWDVIDGEPSTIKGIYTGYAVPLAAIPAVCGAIGAALMGHSVLGVTYRPALTGVLTTAVVTYVLSLIGLYVLALIIETLAPNFGGVKDRLKAFKVAAYASTAVWVAGVFHLLPGLVLLASLLGGLYSLYLVYKGLPKLMRSPPEKTWPYLAVVIVVAFLINIVIGMVVGAVVGATTAAGIGAVAQQGQLGGKVNLGGTEIDLAKLQAASKQMEASAKQMEAAANGQVVEGAVQALPGETLKALLPTAIGGFSRTEVESSAGGVGGLQGSNAEGVYMRGDGRITLAVTDMAAAGGLAGLAGAFNVNSSRETADGYEKMGKVNGRMTTEEYNRQGRSGKYAVLVADRFMVEANGSSVTMEELKAAVSAVGLNGLESLAKG